MPSCWGAESCVLKWAEGKTCGCLRRWLQHADIANWDLVLVYYGTNLTYSCPRCRHVYFQKGTVWELMAYVSWQVRQPFALVLSSAGSFDDASE